MRQSITLLADTQTQVEITGPAVKAAGYYGSGMNQHTIAIYANNFSGRVYIEGSLATNPQDDDWFNFDFNGTSFYTEYAYNPSGEEGDTGVTRVDSFTFVGSYVYLRAVVDRSYLPSSGSPIYGSLSQILLNF